MPPLNLKQKLGCYKAFLFSFSLHCASNSTAKTLGDAFLE